MDTPSLWPFESVLLADWKDPDFWPWVVKAEIDEIIEWAMDFGPAGYMVLQFI
jgi:hypothetical protein